MADVSVKMGVSGISQLKQGMTDAQASIKTLDAALKANEKQLKATGDAESYLAGQTTLLNQKMSQQRELAKNAEAALEKMRDSGVKETSKQYQDMQRKLIEAQSAILDTQMELDGLGQKAGEASGGTDKLATSLGGLNKKLSLDQVISGIDSITGALERAGKRAVDLGKQIWDNITDSAQWADDTATQAMMLNMDVEDYQRYKKVFDTVGELTVQEWQKAKQKVQKAIHDPSAEQTEILSLLGIDTHEMVQGKFGEVQGAARQFEDVFWEIGETLRRKVESGEMTQDLADTYANAIFGKGFAELNPMFALGKTGFSEALEEQNVVTEDSVNKLAELNDTLVKLQGDFDTLKSEVLAGLAPALTSAANVLDSLLGKLLEYLQTDEGKQALADMGKAVEGLFSDLSKIEPDKVVEGFAGVFNGIVTGIQWLDENKDGVIKAMEAIVVGWAGLKVTGGVLDIVKIISGLQGLSLGAASSAGAAAGSAWGGAFAAAVMKAAPWLVGLYTLLNPSAGSDALGDNTIADQAGNITQEGAQAIMDFWEANPAQWQKRLMAVGGRYGNLGSITSDKQAMDIMLNATISDEDVFKQLEDKLGYEPIVVETEPVAPEGAAEELAAQIGPVTVPVQLVPDAGGGAGTGYGGLRYTMHANGLWSVPFDGYMAVLHKGERVVPAREAGGSRNFSSNLYVESMYMNSGTDAEGLAAAIAAANRRTMRGFGS